jgi:hypothetical protein
MTSVPARFGDGLETVEFVADVLGLGPREELFLRPGSAEGDVHGVELRARPTIKESITAAVYQPLLFSKASDRVFRLGSYRQKSMNCTTYFRTPP